MKILYLFNRIKCSEESRVISGIEHDNHFFGMMRLRLHGFQTGYLEIEQIFSQEIAKFLRKKVLNIHFVHLPVFFKIFKYDVVFSSTAFGTLFIKSILFLRRPKWVMFDFNIEGMIGGRRTIKEKLMHFITSRADGILTLSRAEEISMKRMFPAKSNYINFIPLGTDTEFFKPKQVEEENFIMSVGRDPGRDFKTLLEAVKGLDIKLKLTARPESLRKYGDLPINVTVHNFEPLELLEQYAKAKIIILPLKIRPDQPNDSMGCSSLVEAMSMGKAVIATRTSSMESHMDPSENGILVEAGDVLAMRQAIVDLLQNDAKRENLGRRAREFVVRHSSAERYASNLAEYFNRLEASNAKD